MFERQLNLLEIGVDGQKKLSASHVLVIGCGGLGCPVATDLALAGVGNITLIDGDKIEESNLHRQFAYSLADIGLSKSSILKRFLLSRSVSLKCEAIEDYVNENNIGTYIDTSFDLVIDCTDNMQIKYLISDFCVLHGISLSYATVNRFTAYLALFSNAWYLRNVFPDPTPEEFTESCSSAGVLGAFVNHVGSLQALNSLNHLLGYSIFPFEKKLQILDYKSTIRHSNVNIDRSLQYSFRADDEPVLLDVEHPIYVDVREEHEFNKKPRDAINIPLTTLREKSNVLDVSKNIIFCCATGVRARQAKKLYHRLYKTDNFFFIDDDDLFLAHKAFK
ncbi:HesA/MoeB/ThiF family protein [Vibrio campbellii]|uniref:HesA/MoeB/ThiF family protein n=1 Tax=Vibrio campbellii TaxID=680 RepID=UPI00210E1261|nr:HesA/MoeB/ThiF family protein [Vibrio campbellii]UTZ43701.1 hypothetical protein HB764_20740 [Vibrio campbellii]